MGQAVLRRRRSSLLPTAPLLAPRRRSSTLRSYSPDDDEDDDEEEDDDEDDEEDEEEDDEGLEPEDDEERYSCTDQDHPHREAFVVLMSDSFEVISLPADMMQVSEDARQGLRWVEGLDDLFFVPPL